MNKKFKKLVAICTASVLLVGCGQSATETSEESSSQVPTDFSVSYDGIEEGLASSGVSVHDPSVLEADGKYYIYGSHMSAAVSEDLKKWKPIMGDDFIPSNGYDAANPVYGKLFDTREQAFSFTGKNTSVVPTDGEGGCRLWAPDVCYSEKRGLYYMYFCTTSTFNTSTIAYATAKSPEGPFKWEGNLLYSGFNLNNIDKTNVTDYVDKAKAANTYIESEVAYNYEEYPN
nr:family 43 glycosylhydrolase [Eubacterium sp.]